MNRTSSNQTRKWIKITLSHLQPYLGEKKKNYFSYIKATLLIQVAISINLFWHVKENPVSMYFKFNREKIYSYKNTCLNIQTFIYI